MPGGCGDHQDESDARDDRDAIPTASRRRRPATQLEISDLGISDVDVYQGEDGDGYEGEVGDDADADEEYEASQADDRSTQYVENWGHSTRECDDWTVYFRPVVTVTCDWGRVTAIQYSRLAMRLRSLAIILPIHQFTITRVHVCNHILLITIRMSTRPIAGVCALTLGSLF